MNGFVVGLMHLIELICNQWMRLRTYIVNGFLFYRACDRIECDIKNKVYPIYQNKWIPREDKDYIERNLVDLCRKHMNGLECDIDPCYLIMGTTWVGYQVHLNGCGCHKTIYAVLRTVWD